MSEWVRAVREGWVLCGSLPGPDVDEFAESHQVQRALAEFDGPSLLAVQHPHRTPAAVAAGIGLAQSMPSARATLESLLTGHYRRVRSAVCLYRASGAGGTAVGVLCHVDPHAVDEQGIDQVRDSERVFPDVVAERAATLTALGMATSAAMLVPVGGKGELTAAVERAGRALGAPEVTEVDTFGTRHELWVLPPGAEQRVVLEQAAALPLLVADGNHRVAAARRAGLDGLLALVTDGPELRIGPIHRGLLAPGLTSTCAAAAWRGIGLRVEPSTRPDAPTEPGSVLAVLPDGALRVYLPAVEPGEPRPRIDHGVVERLLVREGLGIDPDSEALRALPEGQRSDPEVTAMLLIPAVPFADVLAVHAQHRRMPRKSTYFTPKPRSGLFLARIDAVDE
ncbi:MAG: DUF1015 family protein [Sciscionella sp.]